MTTPYADRAIEDALKYGKALLKFISPNNVGLTGSHECGYYLPVRVWSVYTPQPPTRGINSDHPVEITWQDGRQTASCIKWYGKAKHEYRLTRFGDDFPYLTPDNVGDLLILIPTGSASFLGYVLDLDEDIENVQAALGIEIIESWALYQKDHAPEAISVDQCISRRFRDFCAALENFPSGLDFSKYTHETLNQCNPKFSSLKADVQLTEAMEAEYKLFRIAERKLCTSDVCRLFESIDDFIEAAARIMNRRKSRAGRALENHVEFIFRENAIPHEVRPSIDGKPDILIPGSREYVDSSFPVSKLIVIGVKTTCKDRWRQVLNEGRRVPHKHILTIQQGISGAQLDEMHDSNVSLIVPDSIQKHYPPGVKIEILSLDGFISNVKRTLHIP